MGGWALCSPHPSPFSSRATEQLPGDLESPEKVSRPQVSCVPQPHLFFPNTIQG